jgi:hypothetical protein
MTNASEMTFGVEIETVASPTEASASGLRIGGYHHGEQVPYLPTGWLATRDGSINDSDGLSCEIVSPVLHGAAGLAEVGQALAALREHGHKVNASCGVHVHVGWNRSLPAEALARLVVIAAYAERGLYAITGTKHRERGTYCGGVRRYGNEKTAKESLDRNRYHALNLTNLANHVRDTVEFRVFSGSLDATKVAGWVQVCLGLVVRAIDSKKAPTWTPKPCTGGWAKKGAGASEAERLMGYLAWGAGYAKIHGGQMYGWISDAVPQDAVKAEFRRLAKKYDAEA